MLSPLHSFADCMIDFQVFRNSQLILTLKGLKNTEKNTNKKYIGFFPNVNIQVGDILINSGIKYYITDLDTQTWKGQIASLKAYYQTTPPQASQSGSTIFNISNASNSIIGNQQLSIINNSSFNIDDFKQLIELYGKQDKQELYELVSLLKSCLDKDDFHKSKLSKFSNLIAKHSWLPTAIAQIISAFIQIPR